MKIAEMRELTVEELSANIENARKELFDARFKQSLNQLENTAVLRSLRHQIAQMQTIIAEKN